MKKPGQKMIVAYFGKLQLVEVTKVYSAFVGGVFTTVMDIRFKNGCGVNCIPCN